MEPLPGELEVSCLRPEGGAEFVLRRKRSEFVASLCPASTEEEARRALDAARGRHRSASHNCPAWRIGFPETEEFCSDDGEPAGTAGRPILGCLRRAGVCCAAIVVTRYFGGVKLGARGLIDAYAAAAEGALSNARLTRARPFYTLVAETDYARSADLSRLLRSFGVGQNRVRASYAEKVAVTALVAPGERPRLESLLESYEARSLLASPPRWSASAALHAVGSGATESEY